MKVRRLCLLLTSLFVVGCACVLLKTESLVTRPDMTSQQTANHVELLGRPKAQERNPESAVQPRKTQTTQERNPEPPVQPQKTQTKQGRNLESAIQPQKTQTTQERNPESAIQPPKRRDPEPFDPMNHLKGYVGVPDESKQLSLSCGVCALVTGSGRMLNYKAGNEIDQADCVIRMNEGPVPRYEEHVGSKTTLRVISFRSIQLTPMDADIFAENSTLLGWGPPAEMEAPKGRAYQKLKTLHISHPNLEVYKLTEERMQYADRVFEKETGRPRAKSGAWLSTGWWTMMVAMEICDVIKVYGMIPEDYCRNHPNDQTFYHYFTGAKYRMEDYKECSYQAAQQAQSFRGGGHRYLTEKTIFARWAPLNNITFLNPSWDST